MNKTNKPSHTATIIPSSGPIRLPSAYLDPGAVLADALDRKLETLIVVGFHEDGSFYFSSTTPDGGDALWLLRAAELKLMGVT